MTTHDDEGAPAETSEMDTPPSGAFPAVPPIGQAPGPGPRWQGGPPPVPPRRSAVTASVVVGLLAAVLAVVGGLLPFTITTTEYKPTRSSASPQPTRVVTITGWVVTSTDTPTESSRPSTLPGAPLTAGALLLAAGAVWAAARPSARAAALTATGAGVLAGVVTTVWIGLRSYLDYYEEFSGGDSSHTWGRTGAGIWLVLGAGILALVSVLLLRVDRAR